MVLHHACRGVLRAVRLPFLALLFIFVKLWERQADILLLAAREANSPCLLALSGLLATRDYLYPSSVPFSRQAVHALGVRDSSAADRRWETMKRVGSVASEGRGAQAAAQGRVYDTAGQLTTLESFLPPR